ncbi:MAG: hypothetical protein A3H96_23715 [Acidobacteria bacterium RIFCSPLOWO2_02_FULL_67_36]|nr:MAG: hypothetical protein A3H96_23715 [Acidobacteria bacterium RIFCSPLOWO2_02_FULL_67_36]OFW20553.1 MAG: hypothetical protein A3G21_23325 [Acidobacteria bacterium RIFCSPLOWO2_12_FULL_66_21]
MDNLSGEFRQALRSLVRTPQASLIVISTLALGLAATTVVFSVFDAVWLVPLPLRDSERLVIIAEEGGVDASGRMSAKGFHTLRADRGVPAEIAAAVSKQVVLQTQAGLELTPAASVTQNFFNVLGIEAMLGRTFASHDAASAGLGAMVVSEELWRTRLGGDRETVGKTIRLGSESYTLLGVLPAGMPRLVAGARLWTLAEGPLPALRVPGGRSLDSLAALEAAGVANSLRYLHVVGRLDDEFSFSEAAAAANSWSLRTWSGAQRRLSVVPLRRHLTGAGLPGVLQALAAAGFLLLVTCASVANVLLARAVARRREIELRVLLGASQGRILRQVFVESWLLAMAGGVLGLVGCYWAVGLAGRNLPPNLPRLADLAINSRVVAFTLSVAFTTGTLVAATLALGVAHVCGLRTARAALREASGPAPGRRDRSERGGHWIVLAQVALAVMLACGAALVARSVTNLLRIEPGFAGDNLVVVRGAQGGMAWTQAEIAEAERRLERVPGVVSVATGTDVPPEGVAPPLPVKVQGTADGPAVIAGWHVVSPTYFRTVGIPLLKGRSCTSTDLPNSPAVAVVSQEGVRRLALGEQPLGRRIGLVVSSGADPWWVEVVGVVADARFTDVRQAPGPEIFYCAGQNPRTQQAFVIRSTTDPNGLLGDIRGAIVSALPHRPIRAVQAVKDLVAAQQATLRVSAGLFGIFAGIAILLAALSLYGVVAVAVARRRHELAIRVALGATRANLAWLAVVPVVWITALGLVLGALATLGLQRYLRTLLFGVAGLNATMFAEVSFVFLVVAVLASLPAALHAARTQAAVSLREP